MWKDDDRLHLQNTCPIYKRRERQFTDRKVSFNPSCKQIVLNSFVTSDNVLLSRLKTDTRPVASDSTEAQIKSAFEKCGI